MKRPTAKAVRDFGKSLLPVCAASAIALATSTSFAHAQSFSIGDMLQPGGVDIGLGITATATNVTTGTGSLGPGHALTGVDNPNFGGIYTGVGFDPTRPAGLSREGTRVQVSPNSSVADGLTQDFQNAIGFHITFSSPVPLDYFYGLDIESREWKTSFAFNGTTPILPTHLRGSTTALSTTLSTVDTASWTSGMPTLPGAIPSSMNVTIANDTPGSTPDDPNGQVIFDYAGASATDVVFLYGFGGGGGTGTANSGVSALTLDIPQLDATKSASVGALQADGTVDVTYTLNVANPSSELIENLTLTDELANAANLGTAFNSVVTGPAVLLTNTSGTSIAPTPNASYDGTASDAGLIETSGQLAPGDSYQVTFTVNVDATGPSDTLPNTASAAGTSPSFPGRSVTDNSDPVASPVPGGAGAPVEITLPALAPLLETTKWASFSNTLNADGTLDVTYNLTVENTGNVNFENLTLTDILDANDRLGAAFNNVVGTVQLTGAPTGITPNGSFDGTAGGDPALISVAGGAVLAPSDSFEIQFTVNIDPEETSDFTSSAIATGADPSGDVLTDLSENDAAATGSNSTDGAAAGSDVNGSNVTVIDPPNAPVAGPNTSANNTPQLPVEVAVLGDDTDADGNATIDAESVSLVVPMGTDPMNVTTVNGDVVGLVIPDVGTWSVNPTTGTVTFTPVAGFVGNPDPVSYTVDDEDGNTSDPASVTVTYANPAPTIELVQTIESVSDTNNNGIFGDAGDTINYVYTAENTGDTALADVTIDNQGFGALTGSTTFTPNAGFDGTLLTTSGAVDVAVGTYVITDPDIVAGQISTQPSVTSTAVATDDTGAIVTDINGDPIPLANVDPVIDLGDAGSEPAIPQGGAAGTNAALTEIATPSTSGSGGNDATVLTLPVIAPEIAISSSITGELTDGVTVDDQGALPAGVERTITYTITNDGFGPLTLSDTAPVVTGVTNIAGDVAVSIPSDIALDPFETTTFTVTFTPEFDGPFGFDIDVLSNDADEATFDIPVTGNSEGVAEIDVTSSVNGAIADGGSDDQGEQLAGQEQTITYNIVNNGTDNLALTANPTVSGEVNIDGPVVVTVPSNFDTDLAPGEATTFTVTYTPLDEGDFNFDIVIPNDDEDEGPYNIAVTGFSQVIDIEAIEAVLSDDLQRTTEMLSRNVSDISRRAADRLNVGRGQACGEEINSLLRANPIQFATDRAFIDARNNAVLDEITLILNQCSGASFMIAGHTDSRASDAYNLVLSQNRVDAVQDALIRRGIASARLQTEGFGESRPVASNDTEEGMALNRRVEFILLSDGDGLNQDFAAAGRCGEDSTLVRNLDGSVNNAGGNLTGNYASSGYNCLDGTHREVWADLSVTNTEDAGTTGMLSFGASRERQANNRLFGQFVEGYLSETNVDNADVIGSITGVGIHAGLFGANASDEGLLFNYYGSVAVGRHEFDLTAGADADGHYDYAGLFVGGAIGGKQELENLTLAPRVGIDLAYSETVGSEISVPGVDLEIDPATYGRLFAEVDLISALEEGEIELTPRVFCAVSGEDAATDCGFGASISYETFAEAENAHWDVTLDYDQISDTRSASLNVARSQQIFDGAGVSKSSLGATQAGSLSAEQTIEFSW